MAEKPQERVINVVLPDGRQGRLRVPASFTDEQVAEQMAVLGARPVEQPGMFARARAAAQPVANALVNAILGPFASLEGVMTPPGGPTPSVFGGPTMPSFTGAPTSPIGAAAAELLNPVPGSGAEAGALVGLGLAGRAFEPLRRAVGTVKRAGRSTAGTAARQGAATPTAALPISQSQGALPATTETALDVLGRQLPAQPAALQTPTAGALQVPVSPATSTPGAGVTVTVLPTAAGGAPASALGTTVTGPATASEAAMQLLRQAAIRTGAVAGGATLGSAIERGEPDLGEVLAASVPVAAVEAGAQGVGALRRARGAARLQPQDVEAVTEAINRVLPESITIRPGASVHSLSNAAKTDLPQSIARQAGENFRSVLREIRRELSGRGSLRPSQILDPSGRVVQNVTPPSKELADAILEQIDQISARGIGVRQASGTMTGAGQRAAVSQHQMVEDLTERLAQEGFADLAALYQKARSDYFRSLTVARLLEAPGVIQGGRLNMQELQKALARTAGLRGVGVPQSHATDLREAIFRGAPSMAATDMPGGFGVMRLLLSLTRPRIGLTERLGGLGLPDFAGTPERLRAVLPPDATVADVLALLATQRASGER